MPAVAVRKMRRVASDPRRTSQARSVTLTRQRQRTLKALRGDGRLLPFVRERLRYVPGALHGSWRGDS